MKPSKRKYKSSKRIGEGNLKHAAKITGIIFAICIILALLFSYYTNSIIGRLLKEVVHYRSDGYYELRYDDINYNFVNKTLYVKNLHFEADSADMSITNRRPGNKDNIYNAFVPEMLINIADIWKVYLNRELDIDGITAYQPDFNISSFNENKYKKWQADAGILYDIIAGYLQIFRINNFKIENGRFLFEKHGSRNRKYEIEDISFSIKNFLLQRNAKQNKDKFFYTDDIDISLKNQKLLLKDSIHKLEFKQLILSTTKSKILVDSLVISKREDLSSHPPPGKYNTYHMYVPSILLDSVNFKEAYKSGLLQIGKLLVHRPEIQIDKQRHKKRSKKDTLNNNLSTLIAEYFENVRIDTLHINNASVGFSNLKQQKREQFTLDSTNITLTNLVLDSTIFEREHRTITYDHINIQVNDYEFLLPDSIHKVSFSRLKGSSASQVMEVKDIKLQPRDHANIESLLRKNNRKSVFYGNIPKIRFNGIYGREFINEDSLKMNAFTLYSPNINIVTYQHLPAKSDTFSFSNVMNPYPLISKYFDALYLNNFELLDADIEWNTKDKKSTPITQMRGVNLKLEDIAVDSATDQNQMFASKHIDLFVLSALQNIQGASKIVKTDSLSYSSKSRNLSTGPVEFYVLNDSNHTAELVSGLGDRIRVFGFNMQNLLQKSGTLLDTLVIYNPVFNYRMMPQKHDPTINLQQIFSEYYDLALVRNVQLKNASFNLFDHNEQKTGQYKYSANFENLHFDSIRQNILPIADGYQFNLNESYININDYSVKIDSAHVSNLSSISYFKDLSIKQTGDKKTSMDVLIPSAEFSHLDLHQYYKYAQLNFGNCKLSNPSFSFTNTKDTTFSNEESSDTIPLARKFHKYLNKIHGKSIEVFNGQFSYQLNDGATTFQSLIPSLNLSISDIGLDSLDQDVAFGKLMNNLAFDGNSVQVKAKNILDTLYIDKIQIPKSSEKIKLSRIHFSNYPHLDSTHYEGALDSLIVESLNYSKLLDKKRLESNTISIFQPDIFVSTRNKKRKTPLKDYLFLKNINLQNKPFRSVDIDRINTSHGDLKLQLYNGSKTMNFSINDLNFSSDNFVINEGHNVDNKLLASDNFKLSFKNLSYVLPDSLNRVEIGEIYYSTYDSTLAFNNLTNSPLVPKYDYGPAKGIQRDWLDMKFNKIQFKGLHPMVSLQEDGVIANQLIVDGMDIYAFRDKRIPREEDLHKKLPQQRLLDLDYIINIDTVQLKHSTVTYEEVTKAAPYSGSVNFTELQADMYNLCNQESILKQNPYCVINASGKLMNEGLLEAKFTFDLTDPDNTFLVDASLHEMDLRKFNVLLEPIVRIKVKSGKGKSLTMKAKANNELSIGDMNFYYDNLKVSVLNKNNYTTKGMGATINSFFANTFIINKKNPRLIFNTEGYIYYERDTTRSIFNYWSKMFFSGIVSSIGAKSNKKEIRQYERSKENDKLTNSE